MVSNILGKYGIAATKVLFLKIVDILLISPQKAYVVGTH